MVGLSGFRLVGIGIRNMSTTSSLLILNCRTCEVSSLPLRDKEDVLVSDAVEEFIERDGLTKSSKRSYKGILHLFVDRLVDRRMYMREL